MNLVLPKPGSHKGDNGRVLVIGGSKLFHASIFWSADVASRWVDIVHFSSPAMENNDLVRVKAKEKMWSGIVVPWNDVEEYIKEDDSILIGPGMPREDGLFPGERSTKDIVNDLVGKYQRKKWVIDGGALQEINHTLLNGNMIITPHKGEWERLVQSIDGGKYMVSDWDDVNERKEKISAFSLVHNNVTVLSKGVVDVVVSGSENVEINGGNEGLTKGGSGDVLAGLVTAFYAKSESVVSCLKASKLVKIAGDNLKRKSGVFFNTNDLVEEIALNMAILS